MPVLFRSEAQRNEVCSALCQWTGHRHLWTLWPGYGPSDRALRLTRDAAGHSPEERATAQIAVALWEGRGELRFNDLLADMDVEARRAVDALLEALLGGPDEVDTWIEEHAEDSVDEDAASAQRARELRHTGTL